MAETVPPTRASGDVGHVGDHNLIRTDILDLDSRLNIVENSTLGSTAASGYIFPSAAPYNAVGDGVTDDTTALQNALNDTTSGKILVIDATKRYRHTAVLSINNAGASVMGQGVLMATVPAASALKINANNVTINGPRLQAMNVTSRLTTPASAKLYFAPGTSGAVVRNVLIHGSASAGMFMETASNFLVEDCAAINTWADSYHMTAASHDGKLRRISARSCGDDGVAVVSYISDGAQCYNITVEGVTINTQYWGRGLSVVGGHDVTFSDFTVESSNAAALYVASETGSFNTYGVANVTFRHGVLMRSNMNYVQTDHGAIQVWCAQTGQTITDVVMDNIFIGDTHASTRQVHLNQQAGTIQRMTLTNFTINNGPVTLLTNSAASSAYNSSGWVYNGAAQAAHAGW